MVCFELIYGANSKEMDAKHGLTNPKRRKEFYIQIAYVKMDTILHTCFGHIFLLYPTHPS